MMNTLIRSVSITMISLLLLAMSGCIDSASAPDKAPESPQVTYPQESPGEIQIQLASQEPYKFEVLDSDRIPGWKKLNARVSVSELTEHGSQPTNDNRRCDFSIHFPGSWTLISSVLYDGNNKKAAEIPPVVLLKTGQETVFLDYRPVMDEELISHEQFNINSCQGSKTITRIATESGMWCPHIYRLIDETYGFTIVFYSERLNAGDQMLYDRIVNTFSLEG